MPRKALFLDLWGTIVKDKGFINNFRKKCNLVPDLNKKEFSKRFAYCCFLKPFQDYSSLIKTIFQEFGKKPQSELLTKAESFFQDCLYNADIYPDVKYLWDLKKDYKFALLTNTISPNFDVLLESLDLKNKFDLIAPSFKVHSIKPQPEIYQFALKKLKVKPENTFMISDSILDLDGALALDINPLLIDRRNTKKYQPKIKSFKELPKFLEVFEWK